MYRPIGDYAIIGDNHTAHDSTLPAQHPRAGCSSRQTGQA